MFFKKYRDGKKAAADEARQNVLKDFQTQFEAAQQSADPADKFLKLESIKTAIDGITSGMKAKYKVRAKDAGETTYLGFTATGLMSAVGAMALHVPPLLVLAAPVGGFYFGIKQGRKMMVRSEQKAINKDKEYLDALGAQRDRAAEAADTELNTSLRAIAESKRFEEVVKTAPRVRDHFTAAYGRQVTGQEPVEAPEPPKQRPQGGLQL